MWCVVVCCYFLAAAALGTAGSGGSAGSGGGGGSVNLPSAGSVLIVGVNFRKDGITGGGPVMERDAARPEVGVVPDPPPGDGLPGGAMIGIAVLRLAGAGGGPPTDGFRVTVPGLVAVNGIGILVVVPNEAVPVAGEGDDSLSNHLCVRRSIADGRFDASRVRHQRVNSCASAESVFGIAGISFE